MTDTASETARSTPGTPPRACRNLHVVSPGGEGHLRRLLARRWSARRHSVTTLTRHRGPWGSGRQYMSWMHETDFARAVEFLIEREDIAGVVNLAAPDPLLKEQFLSSLRDAWGIRFGLPAQKWMLEFAAFFLKTETELLLKSRRVVSGTLRQRGFEFCFPRWPEAALDLVRKWRSKDSVSY